MFYCRKHFISRENLFDREWNVKEQADLDVNLIRQNVDRTVIELANVSITQKDVATLVSHTFTCKYIKQSPYYCTIHQE